MKPSEHPRPGGAGLATGPKAMEPTMSRSLHASDSLVELTISGYLVGFSFGQLLWGPISDRYGRRPEPN